MKEKLLEVDLKRMLCHEEVILRFLVLLISPCPLRNGQWSQPPVWKLLNSKQR